MVPAPVSWRGGRGWGFGASEPAEEPGEQEQNDHCRQPVPDATVDPVHDNLLGFVSPELVGAVVPGQDARPLAH